MFRKKTVLSLSEAKGMVIRMNILENNPFKEKLARGEIAYGFQMQTHSPAIAEAVGFCEFDWLYIDTEHSIGDDSAVENTARAAIAGGIVPVLRIPTHDAGRIGQFLDMGIAGLIFPHVDTPEQAKAIVKAGKSPPLGERGAAFGTLAARYGMIKNYAEYVKRANENVSLIADSPTFQ